jgi:hypothetical protein
MRKKRPENGHETTDFSCKTMHLHISRWSKSTLTRQYDGLGASAIFSRLVITQLFSVSVIERTVIRER